MSRRKRPAKIIKKMKEDKMIQPKQSKLMDVTKAKAQHFRLHSSRTIDFTIAGYFFFY